MEKFQISRRYMAGEKVRDIAREFDVCENTVRRIARGEGCAAREPHRPAAAQTG